MRSKSGFTLIELMIVIAIIAIIALIAIPNLLSSRLVATETSTIGTLRSLSSAQAEFQARQIVDQDSDGIGEYGFLQELAGSQIPRGATEKLNPPSISQALGTVGAASVVTKSGFVYVFYLPGGAGAALLEPAAGSWDASKDETNSNVQESRWACYAIPQTIRNTGNRAFVINQQAEVYATTNAGKQNYDLDNIAALTANAMAAYEDGATNLGGKFATGTDAGQDSSTWVPAS